MDLQRFNKKVEFTCPICGVNIEEPKWRTKCLFSPLGLPCFGCRTKIRLCDTYWYALLGGSALLIAGGRLWSVGSPLVLCFLLLFGGAAVLWWGIMTS